MEAFCFKCRGKHALLDPQPIFFANRSPASVGMCSNCGNPKVYKMGRTPAHEGLTPPERVARPKDEAGPSPARKAKSQTRQSPLVIVESPAKARTIGKFLGRKFHVHASIGHIRDLPKNRLGVDVTADFEPRYVVPVDKKAVVKELKALARNASEIWLATDPDREGEAISWHLTHVLDKEINGKPVRRVEFHEITQHAVDEAFAHPRELDRNLVDAQQARRIMDRLVGYTLSPLLRDKMQRKGLSAGRVQSVALRLVCERERNIQRFQPVEYWTLEAELSKRMLDDAGATLPPDSRIENQKFTARLYKLNGADLDLKTEADTQQVVEALRDAAWIVTRVDRRDRARRPAAPFTTSTLQQEASRKLGFNARRTMAAAQQLYEGIDVGEGPVGLITYMRTDSTNVAISAQAEARDLIAQRYGPEFLPDQPPKYNSRSKNAQEAHEAIRPTSVFRAPEDLKEYLERDQFRLYDLVWKRFIASQMAGAVYDATSVDIEARPTGQPAVEHGEAPAGEDTRALTPATAPAYLFRATGSIIKFPGFLKVYEEGRDEGDPSANGNGFSNGNGDTYNVTDRRLPELTEQEDLDLLQLLPSQHFTQPPPRFTEASLIKALEEYGIGRPSTYATTLGIIQSRYYVTREGKQLRPTALGLQVNDLLVNNFPQYIDVGFTAQVEDELDSIETGERHWRPVLHAFYDPFKETVAQAAQTIPQIERVTEYTGEKCPKCGSPLVYKQGRFGRFIGCLNFPQCRHIEPIGLPGVACPKCGGKLTEKRMRKGRRVFYGCANYPTCDFTTWNRPIAMACPTGDGGLMVEAGKGKAKCLTCEQVFDMPEESGANA